MAQIYPLIETEELAAAPTVRLFDVTAGNVPDGEGAEIPASEGFATGHIPGARWLDQARLLTDTRSPFKFMAPQPAEIARIFADLGVSDDSIVVLYSQTGYGWPTRVWWLLQSIGFRRARVLNGGLQKWRREARPLENGISQAPAARAGRLSVDPQAVFVDAQRVQSALAARDTDLIDALAPRHYRGETAGNYGRSGHIPGALNVPSGTLIQPEDNRFLPPEALREQFHQAGATAGRPILTYCGGGIAASIDAFAARLAGWPAITIYDASLAQWAADERFPMDCAVGPSA